MKRTAHEELVHFLSDIYSVEQQALAQLVSAPRVAGDGQLAADFRTHHQETEGQAAMVRQRLEELGGSPSAVKDAIMKLGGKGMLLFARMQLESPGRLLTHAYSYEAMEWAAYSVLIRLAMELDDEKTAEIGRRIQAEERTMMRRLERRFDEAEDCSHQNAKPHEVAAHVRKHMAEVHALEAQSEQLLAKAVDIAGDGELGHIYRQHLEETRAQIDVLEQRMREMETEPSILQDAALRLGALNWALFFQMQKDTPAKLAIFAYAVEHLEIGAYELLRRTARRAADVGTEELCERIIAQERAMAERIADGFDLAVSATTAAADR